MSSEKTSNVIGSVKKGVNSGPVTSVHNTHKSETRDISKIN